MRRRADTEVPAGANGVGSGWQPLRGERAIGHSSRRQLLLLETVGSVGYEAAMMEVILGRSDMSTRSRYLESEGKENCFFAAFDAAVDEIEVLLADAVRDESRWLDRVRNSLCRLLDFLDDQPRVARALIVEAPLAGPPGRLRWNRILNRAAQLIDMARLESETRESPPDITADAVVSGIYGMLWSRLANAARGSVRELGPDLVHYAALPYFGPEIARQEMVAMNQSKAGR